MRVIAMGREASAACGAGIRARECDDNPTPTNGRLAVYPCSRAGRQVMQYGINHRGPNGATNACPRNGAGDYNFGSLLCLLVALRASVPARRTHIETGIMTSKDMARCGTGLIDLEFVGPSYINCASVFNTMTRRRGNLASQASGFAKDFELYQQMTLHPRPRNVCLAPVVMFPH